MLVMVMVVSKNENLLDRNRDDIRAGGTDNLIIDPRALQFGGINEISRFVL